MIRKQFAVFLLVGLACAVLDICTMQTLLSFGFHAALAASVGFVVGLAVNYVAHMRFTFQSRHTTASMIRFAAIVSMNYALTLGLVTLSVSWIGSALVGKIASLPLVAINGFLWSRYWIFK